MRVKGSVFMHVCMSACLFVCGGVIVRFKWSVVKHKMYFTNEINYFDLNLINYFETGKLFYIKLKKNLFNVGNACFGGSVQNYKYENNIKSFFAISK